MRAILKLSVTRAIVNDLVKFIKCFVNLPVRLSEPLLNFFWANVCKTFFFREGLRVFLCVLLVLFSQEVCADRSELVLNESAHGKVSLVLVKITLQPNNKQLSFSSLLLRYRVLITKLTALAPNRLGIPSITLLVQDAEAI